MIAVVPHFPSDFSNNRDEVLIVFFYFVSSQGGAPAELSPEFFRHGEVCEVELPMPNVDPDDIEIHYRDRQIFVAARVDEGNFYAAMTLPCVYDEDTISAAFDGENLRIALHQNETLSASKRVIYV